MAPSILLVASIVSFLILAEAFSFAPGFARRGLQPCASPGARRWAAIQGDVASAKQGSDERALVDDLLSRIQSMDRGITGSPEQRQKVDDIILQLNEKGKDTNWLEDASIFDNFNVAYVSSGKSQKGNPAGGRFRGRVGRAVFRTTNLFQHLLQPNEVVNMVQFRLLGVLPGCVTLRGDFRADTERRNFVKADFDSPRITLGKGRASATVKMGPTSSVAISCSYLDDNLRLGVGGRGSLFVFTRGGAAQTPEADLWRAYCKSNTRAKVAAVSVFAAGAIVAWRLSAVAAAPFGLIGAVLLLGKGGIIGEADAQKVSRGLDKDDTPQVATAAGQ